MKSKLILVSTITAMSLFLFACSSASEQSPTPEQTAAWKVAHVDISYSGEGKSLEVTTDGPSLVVALYSHPSSGVRWELIEISDKTVLEELDHQFKPFEERIGCSRVVGSPGKETWTFKALGKGESTITLGYRDRRPGEEIHETLVLTTVVK